MNSREAFERYQAKEIKMDYEEFKARFDYQEQNFESRYASGSELSKEFKAWDAAFQEQQKVIDEQQKRISFLEMNIKYVLDHFYMNDLDKAMPRVYEDLKEALRGDVND